MNGQPNLAGQGQPIYRSATARGPVDVVRAGQAKVVDDDLGPVTVPIWAGLDGTLYYHASGHHGPLPTAASSTPATELILEPCPTRRHADHPICLAP